MTPNNRHWLRSMAAKYLRLARGAGSESQRRKFLDYSMLYAQLAEQSGRHANTHPTESVRSLRR